MRYFTLEEFNAEDESQFHPGFLNEADNLRHKVGWPFILTSGIRSLEYNMKIGGSSRSLHIWDKPQRPYQRGCMAMDVAVGHPSFKMAVSKIALEEGWSLGINDRKKFIHLDRRVDLGENQAIFSY